jgi:hypothetical protein
MGGVRYRGTTCKTTPLTIAAAPVGEFAAWALVDSEVASAGVAGTAGTGTKETELAPSIVTVVHIYDISRLLH